MNMFRELRADEIDCRISQIKKTKNGAGLSLLLYKDARCDQNILDETVGPMNWERKHSRENANCIVSIWCAERQCWVSKEDTGTKSNTEEEKGLASDSFKRACFNWGIGRELYTAPFIWIDGKDCNIREDNGRLKCWDNFTVKGIAYTDGVITGLIIKNQSTGKICYRYGSVQNETPDKPERPDNEPEAQEQKPKAQVTINDKVPQPKKPDENPVKAYISNELTFMKEMFRIPGTKEISEKFGQMRKQLIEQGIIDDISSDKMTMEDAEKMFSAIYEHFKPGDAA